jgi:hypothetical protein
MLRFHVVVKIFKRPVAARTYAIFYAVQFVPHADIRPVGCGQRILSLQFSFNGVRKLLLFSLQFITQPFGLCPSFEYIPVSIGTIKGIVILPEFIHVVFRERENYPTICASAGFHFHIQIK